MAARPGYASQPIKEVIGEGLRLRGQHILPLGEIAASVPGVPVIDYMGVLKVKL